MDYTRRYLGTSIRIPSWSLLILGAPAPEKIGGILISEDAKRSINFDANWGLILKIGDRAFEENKEDRHPYKPGQWVMFEDFHPEARFLNETLVYFIPDSRIICELDEPETFEPFVNFFQTLPEIENRAAEKREHLLARYRSENQEAIGVKDE